MAINAGITLEDEGAALKVSKSKHISEFVREVQKLWNSAYEHGPSLSRHSPETNLQHADADDAKCDTQANMFANASVVEYTDTDGDSITFKLENRHINYYVNGTHPPPD